MISQYSLVFIFLTLPYFVLSLLFPFHPFRQSSSSFLISRHIFNESFCTEKAWTLRCPLCRCNLLQCDNCFALIMGPDPAHPPPLQANAGKAETSSVGEDPTDRWGDKGEKRLAQADFIICLECGFINLLLTSVRKKLHLKPIHPLDFPTIV